MTRPVETRAERRRRIWRDACKYIVTVEICLIVAVGFVLLMRAFAAGTGRVPWQ